MQNSADHYDGVFNENEASESETYAMNVDAYYMSTDGTIATRRASLRERTHGPRFSTSGLLYPCRRPADPAAFW